MFKSDDDDDEYFLIISCDLGLHSYTGNVSLPFTSDKPATHALVFILHGITTPWKQTVAYYFTPDATPGNFLWQVIDIDKKVEKFGWLA